MGKLSGFSLIELLVVLTIITILTSVAIPQYQEYKKSAYDFRAESDLRNVAVAEEAYYLRFEKYLSCVNQQCSALDGISSLSKGVELEVNATSSGFIGTAHHPLGTGKIFVWNSNKGGFN